MKIKGLNSFIKKIEKRLVKEIDYKEEPFVVVDGIKIITCGGNTEPLVEVSVRAGYKFNEQLYQTKENLKFDADGNNLEYIAGVFSAKIEDAEFEII